MIGFENRFQIFLVYSDRDPHEHVLRSFDDVVFHAEEVGFFKCFESKVVVLKVAIVYEFCIDLVCVILNDFEDIVGEKGRVCVIVCVRIQVGCDRGKDLFCVLVQVRDCDTRCEF